MLLQVIFPILQCFYMMSM